MTRDEFDEICKVTCPFCGSGLLPKQRIDTKEWTHTQVTPAGQHGRTTVSALCLASGFRNSHFADEMTGG